MDGYIKTSGFVLHPYVFVAGPNKQDCSRPPQQRGKFWQVSITKVYYQAYIGTSETVSSLIRTVD